MTEERKQKRLNLLVTLGVGIVLLAGIGIGAYRFSVADNAEQPDAIVEQPGKSAGDTKLAATPAAKPLEKGTPEKSGDGGSSGEVTEEASNPNGTSAPGETNAPGTTSAPGATNTRSAGSTGSGSGSGGGTTAPDSNAGKTWHEGWNEWVVDVPGHYEQQLVSAAWDEETGHYGNRCNDCGAEITGHAGQHLLDTGHSGYTNYYWFIDGTIHHDAVYQDIWIAEQGHSIRHEGYWE